MNAQSAPVVGAIMFSQLSRTGRLDAAYNLALQANRREVDALLARFNLLSPPECAERLLGLARGLPINGDALLLVTPGARPAGSDRQWERLGARTCEELALYIALVAKADAVIVQAEREARERAAVAVQQRVNFDNLRGLLGLPPSPPQA